MEPFRQMSKGLTLVELLIVFSIVMVVAAFAYPVYVDSLRNRELTTFANDLIVLVNRARGDASLNRKPVTFCAQDPRS